MNKKYMLVGVGGRNGEIWSLEGKFERMEDVVDYMNKDGVMVWDDGVEKDLVVDMNWCNVIEWEDGGGNDGLEEWLDKGENVSGVWGVNEGLELYELNGGDRNQLEVPIDPNYNNIMIIESDYKFDDWVNGLGNLTDAQENFLSDSEVWVDEEISKVYWAFRDDISDVSGERLDAFLNGTFKKELMEILWEENKYFGG